MMEPLLSLDHVTRKIRGTVPVTLVEDATIAIEVGEYIAVTGPSGCGKSSLLYLLGYEDMTLDQIKNFRQLGSSTAGHP